MTSIIGSNEIIKQDVLGRAHVGKERREALLAEFEKSGVNAAEFARLVGIKYHTFITWVQKARGRSARARVGEGEKSSSNATAVQLLEAVVEKQGSNGRNRSRSGELVVELPGGSRMEVCSPIQAQIAAQLVILIAQGVEKRC